MPEITASSETAWGAWNRATRNDPYPLFDEMRSKCPVHQVRLADGHDAWLVIGYDAARQALKDTRLSKDMIAALDEDPEVADAGLPGPDFARHMLAVDGDDHTRLRHLVSRAFAPPGLPHSSPRSNASRAISSTNSKPLARTRLST
jgi:cytochrome P450